MGKSSKYVTWGGAKSDTTQSFNSLSEAAGEALERAVGSDRQVGIDIWDERDEKIVRIVVNVKMELVPKASARRNPARSRRR